MFFEEKLTDFSLFHATIPAEKRWYLEHTCQNFAVDPKKEHVIAEDIIAEDIIAEDADQERTQGRREAYPPDLKELVHTATKLPPMNTPLKLSEKISETWPHGIQ